MGHASFAGTCGFRGYLHYAAWKLPAMSSMRSKYPARIGLSEQKSAGPRQIRAWPCATKRAYGYTSHGQDKVKLSEPRQASLAALSDIIASKRAADRPRDRAVLDVLITTLKEKKANPDRNTEGPQGRK